MLTRMFSDEIRPPGSQVGKGLGMSRALIRMAHGVALRKVARPSLCPPDESSGDDVLIEVLRAGICRTDLQVARGHLPCQPPRVLGHEVVGIISALGSTVEGLRVGKRVILNPFVACRVCSECADGQPPHRCLNACMLGVDHDGAFADRLVVPAACVMPVPDALDDARAAMVEPVAAALAVAEVGLRSDADGIIVGSGRIAELCRRVLSRVGVQALVLDPQLHALPAFGSLDFVIETRATAQSLALSLKLLKRGGCLVLKSRPATPVPLDVTLAVRRELRIQAAGYGSFEHAITMLAERSLDIDDLIGPVFPLSQYEAAFDLACKSESQKIFLAPGLAQCAE